MRIDWGFISELEGGAQLVGYVPAPETSRSGVTIATGFDLGQRGGAQLAALDLPDGLADKLLPYCGVIRQEAVALLEERPLEITAEEAAAIDAASHRRAAAMIARRFDADRFAGVPAFADLSEAAQTVVCSVGFQYGVNLDRRTPKFWRACVSGRWADAEAELRDFGDDYPTRRGREADLLASGAELA